MSAILFGSISTIADTSELQRQAFNEAFEKHGLGWNWDRDEYLAMLEVSGGQKRTADYAGSVGQEVDAKAVHETKSRIFQERLAEAHLTPRAGVSEAIHGAKSGGVKVGFVTTTSRENVSALIEALSPSIQTTDFDVIVDASNAGQPKPDRAAYSFALESLGEQRGDCVAIEDNLEGVRAAVAAGLKCVAFPNENTAGHDFEAAHHRVDRLDFDELQRLIRSD